MNFSSAQNFMQNTDATPPARAPANKELSTKSKYPSKNLTKHLSTLSALPKAKGKGQTKTVTPKVRDESWREIFATLIDVADGEAPKTRPDIGKYANAADELRRLNVTATEIKARATRYRQTYGAMMLTPSALVRNWSSMATPQRDWNPLDSRTTTIGTAGSCKYPAAIIMGAS